MSDYDREDCDLLVLNGTINYYVPVQGKSARLDSQTTDLVIDISLQVLKNDSPKSEINNAINNLIL